MGTYFLFPLNIYKTNNIVNFVKLTAFGTIQRREKKKKPKKQTGYFLNLV